MKVEEICENADEDTFGNNLNPLCAVHKKIHTTTT